MPKIKAIKQRARKTKRKDNFVTSIVFRNEKQLAVYENFRMVLIGNGGNEGDFLIEKINEYLSENRFNKHKANILDAREFKAEIKKSIGMDLTRADLYYYRNSVWKLNEHYFSVPTTKRQAFLYDFDACLPFLKEKQQQREEILKNKEDKSEQGQEISSNWSNPLDETIKPIGWSQN